MYMVWWKILGIVIAVLILLGIAYYFFHESAQNCYRKARRLHKKGEAAYARGEFELAESYYVKAEEQRKRARELE